MKFFLAREGVAFGPYTEFQVRESIRLAIFNENDLALAEEGKEWMEVSAVLASLPGHAQVPAASQPSPAQLPTNEIFAPKLESDHVRVSGGRFKLPKFLPGEPYYKAVLAYWQP